MSLILENNKNFAAYTNQEDLKQIKEYTNVGAMLKNSFEDYASTVAIIDQNVNYTYKDIGINTGFIRSKLHNMGVNPADNVGVLFSNSIEFVEASLAVMSYGCVAVILPYHLDDKTIYGCSLNFH